jgi:hypothetical protein
LLKSTDTARQSGDWRSRHQKQKRPGKAGAQWSTEILYHEGNADQGKKLEAEETRVKENQNPTRKSDVWGTRHLAKFPLDCITMSAALDASRSLVDMLAKKEPEFGSHAGQLDTRHGVSGNPTIRDLGKWPLFRHSVTGVSLISKTVTSRYTCAGE